MKSGLLDPRITPARPDLAAASLRGKVDAPRYATGEAFRVAAGATALRGDALTNSAQLTELIFGETFVVYEIRNGWAWGQAEKDGYVGYILANRLEKREGAAEPNHMVTALFAHVYAKPWLKCTAESLLPMTSRLKLGESCEKGDYLQIANGRRQGWIARQHVQTLESLDGDPMKIAERFIGAPYLWGGKTASGIDCSGLIQVAFDRVGIRIPRDTDMQLNHCQNGFAKPVPRESARRGDIAFFPDHVGFMLDRQTLLHANASQMAVSTDPLEDVIKKIGTEYEEPFLGLYRPNL